MTEIYLIRHCQAEGNRYRMMQGFWDGEVTALGLQQIDALAERFREIPLDAIYSSDLQRAVLTAKGVAQGKSLPIQTRTALRELNTGPWERRFFGNLCYETPELVDRFLYDAENWTLEGAETYRQVRERALKELEYITAQNESKTIAVVSHGATIRGILSGITGISLSDVKTLPIFRNTSVTKLCWDGTCFQVEYMNDVSHLPPQAQTSWGSMADLRDESLDPKKDRDYYEDCYADAWRSVHGDLKNFSPEPYTTSAERHYKLNSGAVLRICNGEESVGLVDLDPERDERNGAGWISLLYLKEEYRNSGYGIQLLARAIIFYKSLGRRSLRLQVAEENAVARAFYEREGFREIGKQKGLRGSLLLMEKAI